MAHQASKVEPLVLDRAVRLMHGTRVQQPLDLLSRHHDKRDVAEVGRLAGRGASEAVEAQAAVQAPAASISFRFFAE